MQPAEEKAFYDRLAWRIMPIVIAVYFVSIVDKSNVGFAKLQMLADLGMTEASFGFGASLFFIGLLLFEIPSSLAAKHFGLRFWLTRILLTWAAITCAMTMIRDEPLFYALRFLLGVAEAGLYPGLIFYLSCWFPIRHRARVIGLMTLGSAFGNGFGALVSGALLDLDGVAGLAGWQWLFWGTGLMPLAVALLVWLYLPNRIDAANFLDPQQRAYAQQQVDNDAAPSPAGATIISVFWHPIVLALSCAFITVLTALLGVIYWIPTVVREFGFTGVANGLLSAVPWAAVAIGLIFVPPLLKTPRRVNWAILLLGAVGALAFFISTTTQDTVLLMIAIALGTPCISLLLTCLWTFPARYFSGTRAAAAIAAIATYGNLGGFFAPNLMPWAAALVDRAAGGLLVPVACLALTSLAGALLLMSQPRTLAAERADA